MLNVGAFSGVGVGCLRADPARQMLGHRVPTMGRRWCGAAQPPAAVSAAESRSVRAPTGWTTGRSSRDARAGSCSAEPGPSSSPPRMSRVPYPWVAGLSAAGCLETIYLTVAKLTHTEVACPLSGCESVLSSSYAELFGVPLPLLGALAYSAVASLAGFALLEQRQARAVPRVVDTALVAGVAVLATCSAFLMYVLQTRLDGAPCLWCFTSAGLSFSLALSLLLSVDRSTLVRAAAPGAGVLAVTLGVLSVGLGAADQSTAQADYDLPYVEPPVTSVSTDQAVSLAHQLQQAGAKMYGAFWCTHCFEQKQTFGQQAMAEFPYVECYPEGFRRGVKIADACTEANIKAFPTWIINGRTREGELDFQQLQQELDTPPAPAAEAPVAAAAEPGL